MKLLNVVEIFSSIEGEGIRAGYPTTFIRLAGCNLHCSYCDSRYACELPDPVFQDTSPFKEMTVSSIVLRAAHLKNRRITITGGEPLIHDNVINLINELQSVPEPRFEINVETNGSVLISQLLDRNPALITMDWKSPSSGMSEDMKWDNLQMLREQDVLKFVVGDLADLFQMQQVVEQMRPRCNVFVSPVFGKIDLKLIVDFLKANDLQDIRLQLQIHKIIWDPSKRGV